MMTNSDVCIKYWPTNFPTIKGERGKERPKSAVPTRAPVKRCLFESRTRKEDELSFFLQLDRVSFEDLVAQLKAGACKFQLNLVHYCLSII